MSIATSRPARRLVAFMRSFAFYTFVACCVGCFTDHDTFEALLAGATAAVIELAFTNIVRIIINYLASRDSNNA